MRITLFMLIPLIIVPIILFIVEFFLCKKQSKFATILPIITACGFILTGFHAIITAGIMFGIFFVMKYLDKEKQSKQSELQKMNIQDL